VLLTTYSLISLSTDVRMYYLQEKSSYSVLHIAVHEQVKDGVCASWGRRGEVTWRHQ